MDELEPEYGDDLDFLVAKLKAAEDDKEVLQILTIQILSETQMILYKTQHHGIRVIYSF